MENIILNILWIIILGMLAFGIISLILVSNPKSYCYVYLHKEWKQWKYIQKHISSEVFLKYDDDQYAEFKFIPKNSKLFLENEYSLYYCKKDKLCFLSTIEECILSKYDKYNSRKTAELIEKLYLNK